MRQSETPTKQTARSGSLPDPRSKILRPLLANFAPGARKLSRLREILLRPELSSRGTAARTLRAGTSPPLPRLPQQFEAVVDPTGHSLSHPSGTVQQTDSDAEAAVVATMGGDVTTLAEPDTARLPVPPNSAEAEESVLGAILMSAEAANIALEKLHTEDFYRPAHQVIFQAVSDLFDANQPIDAVTVSDALRRGNAVDRVGGVGFPHRADRRRTHGIERRVLRRHRRRTCLAAASCSGWAAISEPWPRPLDQPIVEVLDRSEQAVFAVSERRVGDGLAPIDPLLGPAIEQAEELNRQGLEITGTATGFRDLDRRLAGLHPTNLLIIAGRPGMGKTALALNIAENVAVNDIPCGCVLPGDEPGGDRHADVVCSGAHRLTAPA